MKTFIYLCIPIMVFVNSHITANNCLEKDSLELVKVYNKVFGQTTLQNWDLMQPVRTWAGVGLTADSCHVGSLQLNNFGLVGEFPNVELPQLNDLNLGNNSLTQVQNFKGFQHLTFLNLMNNSLASIPDFSHLDALKFLYLDGNQLDTIPDFTSLTSLKTLSLTGNALNELPDFSNLTSLTFLNASNCSLTSLPDFSNLEVLETLMADHNQLDSLPDFGGLLYLNYCSVKFNSLTELPEFLHIPMLETLFASYNKINQLPTYDHLSHLITIDLSYNELKSPPDFSSFDKIQSIDLSHNLLTKSPDADITSLHTFHINNNRLNFSIPADNGTQTQTYTYQQQDSIAITRVDSNELTVFAGGDLSKNTYKWFKDDVLQTTQVGIPNKKIDSPAFYRCEITNSDSPNLTLYSQEIDLCELSGTPLSLIQLINLPCLTGDVIYHSAINFQQYSFHKNGLLMQRGISHFWAAEGLENNDLISCIAYDSLGCAQLSEATYFTSPPRDQVQICQASPNMLDISLTEGSPPYSFELQQYRNKDFISTTTYFSTTTDTTIAVEGNYRYEIHQISTAPYNCPIEKKVRTGFISGEDSLCVPNPQHAIRRYAAHFFNYAIPSSISWSVHPPTAISAGDISIINGLQSSIIQIEFNQPSGPLSMLTLQAEATTNCGLERLSFDIHLDQDCVWPGDINRDGQPEDPYLNWINDALALETAYDLQEKINDSLSTDTLLSYPRTTDGSVPCYEWMPHPSKDWHVLQNSTNTYPADFPVVSAFSLGETRNLKHADANGDGMITDSSSWLKISVMQDFEDVVAPTDHDIITYNMLQSSTSNGALSKVDYAEHLTITRVGEFTYRVDLGSLDEELEGVNKVAFVVEASVGPDERPTVDISNSHLITGKGDRKDYPIVKTDIYGEPESFTWYIVISNEGEGVTFAGQELCTLICVATVAGFQKTAKQSMPVCDSIPFTISSPVAGIRYEGDSTMTLARSNELMVMEPFDMEFAARLFLEGSFNPAEGLMNDNLRNLNLLPAQDPYNASGYGNWNNLTGVGLTVTDSLAVFSVTGQEAIVDWVSIEIRDAMDPSILIESRSGLLNRQGYIVDMDGHSTIKLEVATCGLYHVVLRHRNHLAVMTTTPVLLGSSPTVLDFTTSQTTTDQKVLTSGIKGMIAGDMNHDDSIDGVDRVLWQQVNGQINVNQPTDLNMDGDINGADKLIWTINNGYNINIPK